MDWTYFLECTKPCLYKHKTLSTHVFINIKAYLVYKYLPGFCFLYLNTLHGGKSNDTSQLMMFNLSKLKFQIKYALFSYY